MKKINFEEGSISFRIPQGFLNYEDNNFIDLVNYVDENGSLRVTKDIDNGLKIYYFYKNKGYSKINEPAPEVDANPICDIKISWSMKKREMKLAINNVEKITSKIEVDPVKFR